MSLSDSAAYDCNFLSSKIIKQMADELCVPLTIIINKGRESGEFPDLLKISRVTPIFKNGDKSDPCNYRPISIVSIFHKIFELAMYEDIMQFLTFFEIINKNQHGFLKNKSTITALFEFVDAVLKGLDDKDSVLAIFLDLSKAFDCVDHEILLAILEHLGIRGVALDLFRSYLSNRKQYIGHCMENGYVVSEMLDNKIGVPQGSILGPILFLLYINDLVVLKNDAFVIKYADDTTFVLRNHNKEQLIDISNNLLAEINTFFRQKKLQLNTKKTNTVGFQLLKNVDKFSGYNLICENDEIEFTNHTKLLGLIVDKSLKWDEHINQLCKRLSKLIYAMRILKTRVNQSALRSVYFAHVHSILSYGIEFWGRAADYQIERVFKFQKKAIRIIAGVHYSASCREIDPVDKLNWYQKLGILPLPALCIAKILIFFKKQPHYFTHAKFNHRYPTRHKECLILESHKTSAYEKNVLY
jgi:hypothetical protein